MDPTISAGWMFADNGDVAREAEVVAVEVKLLQRRQISDLWRYRAAESGSASGIDLLLETPAMSRETISRTERNRAMSR